MTAAARREPLNATAALLGPVLAGGGGTRDALVCGAERLSYAALDDRVGRFGNALGAAGVAPGDRVLLVVKDRPALVAGYLAAMRIGAVAVALSTRADADGLRFALGDSGARVLVLDADLEGEHGAVGDEARADGVPVVTVAGDERAAGSLARFLDGHGNRLPAPGTAAGDPAFWVYTSGTTGRPKAVVHAHRSVRVADRHARANLGVGPGDRVFTTSKLFFSYALAHTLFATLRCGATAVLHPDWPGPGAVAEVVERDRPDVLFSVPTLYRALLERGVAREPGFRGVRHFVSAGEALPGALYEGWREAAGKPVLEGIGASETTFLFAANTPAATRAGATGRALPWAEVELRHDDGAPIEGAGGPGVAWVRMDSVFTGYWGQEERTRAVLERGWYCTGDVFSRDTQGWLRYHGRRDDMLKVSGQWVSPNAVDDAARALPGVADAAAAGVAGGGGLMRIALFVAREEGAAVTGDAILAALRDRLPHHQCPAEVRFVDAIPRTATGKVQRFRLRESGAG